VRGFLLPYRHRNLLINSLIELGLPLTNGADFVLFGCASDLKDFGKLLKIYATPIFTANRFKIKASITQNKIIISVISAYGIHAGANNPN